MIDAERRLLIHRLRELADTHEQAEKERGDVEPLGVTVDHLLDADLLREAAKALAGPGRSPAGAGLLTLPELAAALSVPANTLRRTILSMRRIDGFPEPMPGSGGRYDPLEVEAWRRRRAGLATAALPPIAAVAEPADATTEWQAELDRRSANIACQ